MRDSSWRRIHYCSSDRICHGIGPSRCQWTVAAATPLISDDLAHVLFYTGRFPDKIKNSRDESTRNLNFPVDPAVAIFFNLTGRTDPGDGHNRVIAEMDIRYNLVYDDNEGIFFSPVNN